MEPVRIITASDTKCYASFYALDHQSSFLVQKKKNQHQFKTSHNVKNNLII